LAGVSWPQRSAALAACRWISRSRIRRSSSRRSSVRSGWSRFSRACVKDGPVSVEDSVVGISSVTG